MGDVILSTPVIRFMRKRFPEAYIVFMVRPENKDIVKNNPDLDKVIVYDKYGSHKSFIETVKFAWRIRRERFDTAIALHPTNRAHMIMFLAGIPVRIGYDKNMGSLLTKRIPHEKQKGERHETEYNRDMLIAAGFDVSGYDPKPYIFTSEEERKLVDSVEKSSGLGKEKIAFHAGASCASKRWAPERFAETADALGDLYGYDIILVGSDETSEYSSQIASRMKNRITDLTGVLLLGELVEMLSRCRLFVSNDSGPVHIAVAVGTPVISIFGRNDPGLSPKRWGPIGDKDGILHKPPQCDVCMAHNCAKAFECLKAITPQDVIKEARRILGNA